MTSNVTTKKYRILITGAGRGIGRSIVEILKKDLNAHNLALTARNQSQLEESATGALGDVLIIPGDLFDESVPEKIVTEVLNKWGGIDVLILNAGDGEAAPIEKTDDAMWERAMTLNAKVPFKFIRAAVSNMKENNSGHIVVVASSAGIEGAPNVSAYTASKHAVVGLVRSAASELKKSGITVNAICPSYVDTPMTAKTIDSAAARTGKSEAETRAALAAKQPGGRILTPEEVASAVINLIDCGDTGLIQMLDATGSRNVKGTE